MEQVILALDPGEFPITEHPLETRLGLGGQSNINLVLSQLLLSQLVPFR